MRAALLAFALGVLVLRALPALPSLPLLAALGAVAAVLIWTRLFVLGAFGLGLAWAVLNGHWALQDRLDPALEQRVLWIEGQVSGLPVVGADSVGFVLSQPTSRRELKLPARLRLNWYGGPRPLAGERWRLAVELRSPAGLSNALGQDREAWLLAQGIGATGSVKDGQRLSAASGFATWRDGIRQYLHTRDPVGQGGLLAALVVGDASGITDAQWQLFQDTGTVHLMVISGQHIGLVALGVYALVVTLVRRGHWPNRLPWRLSAVVLTIATALGYGLLAGFEVPVQRACVMVTLGLLWQLGRQQVRLGDAVLLALVLILAANPLVSLLPGFWLSFGAVLLLLWSFAGRLGRLPWWITLGRAQWCMAVGLAPLLLALGLPLSISGPLANAIAVPLMDMAIVPLALVGTLLSLLWSPLGEPALLLAGGLLHVLLWLLAWLAQLATAWQPAIAPTWALWLAGLGALLALLPAGVPLRGCGVLLMLPALFPPIPLPAPGQARITVLDVGQGLAVLVRTRDHTLLYDAGPRQGSYDSGARVVLPNLRGAGVQALDVLLLSHADADHAGGAPTVAKGLPPGQVLSGEADRLQPGLGARDCEDGANWRWNEVSFTTWWHASADSNASSCVLRVEAQGERLLLTGDIDERREAELVASGLPLAAEWLSAPHHGSRSGSSACFIDAVQPRGVLISRGQHNRYGHPHPLVVERYRERGVLAYDTAELGALTWTLGKWEAPRGQREVARWWRTPPPTP
ncbi:DNA internalization-related competence protein ComEC/Rec2 [Pseudomonas rhizoryzae]|uniref:DNA internalization-related competence protein ComEC/Rec2 n=1 Tax=Pseudomonas rhizoryzae TaxID=2571129 RepID=UPI000736C67C|nr:DNA internalization-related competence protein ComEC/Rec2 [Pseudomonas rhizoryzae]KTT30224.1 competence protein ComEC [Pseudomonas psychrotolerans]KTT33615.1 competence protein ComEC [Pseudomonas psychrotolerans]KTT78716.1 competence protein ComEC [Pseudomonas psychrotolerans]